jgi:MFS superfamily sulfate permease-like transporter
VLQVSRAEYLLLLATFLSILQLELEKGVAAGILLCTIYFAVTYARVSTHAENYAKMPCRKLSACGPAQGYSAAA